MKTSMKSLIATGLIALSCTCSAFATPTADQLANEIGQYRGFYTLYAGLPISDYKVNWSNVPGWKLVEHRVGREPLTARESRYATDFYERSYEINGKQVLEKVDVCVNLNKDFVDSFGWSLESRSRDVIDEVGMKIQRNLTKAYARARYLKPWHYTDPTIRRPYFYTTNDGYGKITFYGIIDDEKDKVNPIYRVVLVHSFETL